MDLAIDNTGESLLDLFLFESMQNIEQLEQLILNNEKSSVFTADVINEVFRIMHTIKGSAAMMMFENISLVAHRIEDLFAFMREHHAEQIDFGGVSDLVLESLDFIRTELEKIKGGATTDSDGSMIVVKISTCLDNMINTYQHSASHSIAAIEDGTSKTPDVVVPADSDGTLYEVHILFEEGCQMESLRAFDVLNKVSAFASVLRYDPNDVTESDNSTTVIREKGFIILFQTEKSKEELDEFFSQLLFVQQTHLETVDTPNVTEEGKLNIAKTEQKTLEQAVNPSSSGEGHGTAGATMINVNVAKLDKLMDLIGEMVISEAMVVENPDLKGLDLDNFTKAARQLHKITSELQNTVMSIRMVPLANVFQKMHRIVRDMSKKLGKEVKLEIIGEETEADKNIIAHLSDPLMHLVRNSVDHGIEDKALRESNHKPVVGTVTLEAKEAGSDVLVIVKDDGNGLNKQKILERAKKNGLLKKNEAEMTDKEIYNLIFIPGFSTNDKVTEYSGRGVGMDVVARNIEEIGGSVSVDSIEGTGTSITIKIPLTLAIIDGMNVRVGNSCYTLPTVSIKDSFRLKKKDLITDPDGNEMILVRGDCLAVCRLHKYFQVNTAVDDLEEGIFIMVEDDGKTVCLFADELLGQQQVVVKALPRYLNNGRKIHGLAGCTLLGDGSISLILDAGWFVNINKFA